jgi:4-alpha-glucanotransferase
MTDVAATAGPPDPGAWGIGTGYWDVSGQWRSVPGPTVTAVLAAMGAAGPEPAADIPLVMVDQYGPWPHLPGGHLVLEGGGALEMGDFRDQPDELPLGYHRLERADGGAHLIVAVCPPRCPSPPPGRTWGWSVQLYAARSRASWGIGDFADLRGLVEWASGDGAGFVLVNPLHAPAPGPVPEASPYFPSSRCFLNPLYLRVEDVPGAAEVPSLAALAEKARTLNAERRIDRAMVWACKSEALEAQFARFQESGGEAEFDRYVSHRGRVLDGYTSFCALAEIHGLPWHDWPPELRRPDAPAVAAFASTLGGRTRKRYHAWLQWQCETQLARAEQAGGAGLVCDLAVGVDGGGADAWLWQDTFALGMRVGAPPDDFNTGGQDWGLPPWDPWKLRAAAYEPYVEMLRAVMRPARGVRVDHVMGLFRLFWVPLGAAPSEGAYVHYVWQDMVGLMRLEAWRAGAYVVGEDLGTVEDHVRETLANSGVLSYKLLWFEPRPPPEWPVQALGAVTTHDLPTVAGVWTGTDVEAQRHMGARVNEEASAALRGRLAERTSSWDDRPVGEVIEAVYASLAGAPCTLLVAVLDDAAGALERPNMPGTIDEWPNWCLALPVPLDDIEHSELAAAIARRLNDR